MPHVCSGMFIELHFNICDMMKIVLIILALIAMVGTTTHYAFANMGGPAMGPADSGGGGGSMTNSPILTPSGNYGGGQTTDSGSTGPSDTTTGSGQGTDTGGYTAFYHHQHHMWGSNFWREKRGECPACGEAVPYEHWMDSHGVWHQHHHAWEPNARAVIHGVMPGSDVVRELQ